MDFDPNVDQVNAENQLLDFLFNPDEREMKLIGPGGTGKSWTVRRFIEKTLKEYSQNCQVLGMKPEYENYALTAMTNKAAQSLQDQTGMDVITIHSFLSLTIKSNFATGKFDLIRTRNWSIIENTLIFIDEAFMMDNKLLEELRASTMNCKIVFVGDHRQLDPVDASYSPIELLNVRTVELTIPVRNADQPALQNLCTIMRDNVAGAVNQSRQGVPHIWPYIPLVPGVISHIDNEVDLKNYIETTMKTPSDDHLIMAFSNQRVNQYNNFIRSLRGQSYLFEVGEILISNDTYEQGRYRIKNEQTVEIESADNFISWIKIGDLDVPTQYVTLKNGNGTRVPAIIDRNFHKESIKYFASQAKAKKSSWAHYFEMIETFADFRPRDAATVHKAQGTTKKHVLIDLNDIGKCNIPSMVARMLYVAVSRPRHEIVFFGNLPSKYGGIIF